MPRKKRTKRQRQDETVFYVIEIESWDWGYSFGVNDTRHFDDPYLEFRHLELCGKLLRPSRVKAERVQLTLMPDKRLNEENRQGNKPKAIGSLNLNRGTLQGLLPIPADALQPILQGLSADRLRYAVLDGARLRYRHATVQHFCLNRDYDEEDLPEENE